MAWHALKQRIAANKKPHKFWALRGGRGFWRTYLWGKILCSPSCFIFAKNSFFKATMCQISAKGYNTGIFLVRLFYVQPPFFAHGEEGLHVYQDMSYRRREAKRYDNRVTLWNVTRNLWMHKHEYICIYIYILERDVVSTCVLQWSCFSYLKIA